MKYSIFAFTLSSVLLIGCSATESRHESSNQTVHTPQSSEIRIQQEQAKKLQEQSRELNEKIRKLTRDKKKQEEAMAKAPVFTLPLESFPSVTTNEINTGQLDSIRLPAQATDRENYAHFDDNPIRLVSEHPVSTFSIDVDTGAYANMRRFLESGTLPYQDAIRVEELINYFAYDYPTPVDQEIPFNIITELGPAPWNEHAHILHIGLKGFEEINQSRPAANLVFLVDVSGSMRSPDKLDLLKSSLTLLTQQLDKQDKISLVVYAGNSGVILEPTPGDQKAKIVNALNNLAAGGSTNGGAGIHLAYSMAQQGFINDGINRILLATDGDFNVGTVDFEALKDLVERKRQTQISLTTLGFGTGNYNDHLMEQLADAGNGNYAYIDSLQEARKVLVDQLGSTLQTIAKDVKIQIEFNPSVVQEYRLIGYENRALNREDFNNDKVDAGEIGSGHTVTALYEIVLNSSPYNRIEPLRYQDEETIKEANHDELAFLKLRYKAPKGSDSKLIKTVVKTENMIEEIQDTSGAFRFSASVAAFGQQLRGGKFLNDFDYDEIRDLALGSRGMDPFGYRAEFINLVRLAKDLNDTQNLALQ